MKELIKSLENLRKEYEQVLSFSFLFEFSISMAKSMAEKTTCDGCGKWDFKDSMKTITPPFNGGTIYICLDCWNEFLRES